MADEPWQDKEQRAALRISTHSLSPSNGASAGLTSSTTSFPVNTSNASHVWRTSRQIPRRSQPCCYRTTSVFRYRVPRWWTLSRFLGVIFACMGISLLLRFGSRNDRTHLQALEAFRPLLPVISNATGRSTDPARWLQENSGNKHVVFKTGIPRIDELRMKDRPRAAIIGLVRNAELIGMMQTMEQLEARWNRKYQYPWVFFNDEPFTEEFMAATRNLTLADCYYKVVPTEHWSLPEWIDEDRFMSGLEYMGAIGVGKGWMVSYHHMCRWNSGFFYKHPFLQEFDWYWRVEPNVYFLCDIDYDVFRFMRENDMKYGFNMNILDDARSFPSLWSTTRSFIATHPELLHPEADLEWLLDPKAGYSYNNCQFFSNFEIGSLNFWRGKANEAYFRWLDEAGGFYYERFGDAPVHTLSVTMFIPKSEVWFFRDIGYQHDINRQCPPKREEKCDCEPTLLDDNFYMLVPFKSSQKKPDDTCIRQWLGGEWLDKRSGWSMDGEKAFGGDGYHGYLLQGDE